MTVAQMILDFTEALLVGLAWPIVIVVVALVFKGPLSRLIDDISDVTTNWGSLKRREQKGQAVAEKVQSNALDAEGRLAAHVAVVAAAEVTPGSVPDLDERYTRWVSGINEHLNSIDPDNPWQAVYDTSTYAVTAMMRMAGVPMEGREVPDGWLPRVGPRPHLEAVGLPEYLVNLAEQMWSVRMDLVDDRISFDKNTALAYRESTRDFLLTLARSLNGR